MSNNMIIWGQIFLSIAYIPVLLKVYIGFTEISFMHMQVLGYGPFILAYTY